MEKVTNEERARLESLAQGFRNRLTNRWEKVLGSLSEEQKEFVNRKQNGKILTELMDFLKGEGKKPSDFITERCGWLFEKGCILERNREAFLYALDNCNAFSYGIGWGRRSFRTKDYTYYKQVFIDIISGFANSMRFDVDYGDFLENKLTEEQIAFKNRQSWGLANKYILAYEIDRGNEQVINYVKNALDSGSETAVSYDLLAGIFRCKNGEIHELVCKLLLAARLQEGLRQAICENADCGRIEPFIMIIKTIRENNLIRYSSVKRSVGCWLGLLTPESRDLERISGKSMELAAKCIEDKGYSEQCLKSEDSMELYIALWALSSRDFRDCIGFMEQVIEKGTAHQAMVCGIFMKNDINTEIKQRLAVKAVLLRHNEQNIMAVYLPQLMTHNRFTTYSAGVQQAVKTPMSQRFESREQAEELYDIFKEMLAGLPKKDLEFKPCVFPWNEEALTKSAVIKQLCLIASDLEDNDKIDEVCPLISLIKGEGYYNSGRKEQITMLLSDPKTDIQLDALVSLAGDRETYSRAEVFKILNRCRLKDRHYKTLCEMLKYKSADMRKSIIDLLFKQSEEELLESVKSLVFDKKEEKRTAGLDMIISISESDRSDKVKKSFTDLLPLIENPTSKEQILIDRISGKGGSTEEEEGWGLYKESDDFRPVVDKEFADKCKADFVKMFPNTSLFGNKPAGKISQLFKGKGGKTALDLDGVILALDKLIEEHKNDEYLDFYGEKRLLGSDAGYYGSFTTKGTDGKSVIPFKELWDKFYEDHIGNGLGAFKLSLYILNTDGSSPKLINQFLGGEYTPKKAYMHTQTIRSVIRYYFNNHFNGRDIFTCGAALAYYIAFEAKADDLYDCFDSRFGSKSFSFYLDGKKLDFSYDTVKTLVTAVSDSKLQNLLSCLYGNTASEKDNFGNVFSIRYTLGKRFGYFDLGREKGYDYHMKRLSYSPFTVSSLILAAYKGIITEGFMYKMLMTMELSSALENLSLLAAFKKSGEMSAKSRFWNNRSCEGFIRSILELPYDTSLSEYEFSDEDNKRMDFALNIGENIMEPVLKTEMARGDTETKFSKAVGSIKRIYGAEKLVTLLAAMGKDTLDRSAYFYSYNGVSKKSSLSYLLGVCVPESGDNAEKLRELISKTDVKESRIVETALFSPSWLDIIGDYLGWKGFKSACYYFIAHTNETLDNKMQAVIAKYTPISAEDLSFGAFDIDWCREAYASVGEERFNKIYDAAKYISDGAKHSRARKYADAVLGRLNKDECIKNITEKRNKDTLMAYALIPLENEKDITERYLFIQEFKKQSKKFGAQRKASEGKACECALQNLSKNAGFTDVSRLTLKMETKLFDDIKPLLEWNDIEEIRLKLEIDEKGTAQILCEKGGKALKSVPSKYNKNERVGEFTAAKKQLTEQYRRTKKMFEEAMESETEFTAEELQLLCTNPVLKPIVSALVYIFKDKLGFFCGSRLTDFEGNETKITKTSKLKIAHPFNIFKDGHWHDYQKYLFDNSIVQPFKQVFRELYVKTEEEAQAYRSTRYAGNQIQPAKTVACLKTRRWVADVEEGLQKVYYKENIIASIYALADWFSPADIEAPTLEWVEFYDRKTYKAMKIEDVPDIIFSEVMRDVDLAVSVAHAGAVDPETSHSTVEMRSAIVEFTLPLFKLKNVTLEGSHAFIKGERADYSIHLGSGVVHLQGGPMINILPVHSQHRGKLFLPFVDEDPKTSQIISEILLFAEDKKIKDPFILDQIK